MYGVRRKAVAMALSMPNQFQITFATKRSEPEETGGVGLSAMSESPASDVAGETGYCAVCKHSTGWYSEGTEPFLYDAISCHRSSPRSLERIGRIPGPDHLSEPCLARFPGGIARGAAGGRGTARGQRCRRILHGRDHQALRAAHSGQLLSRLDHAVYRIQFAAGGNPA